MNQREKEKYCMVSLKCAINKNNRKEIELTETEYVVVVCVLWLPGAGGTGV